MGEQTFASRLARQERELSQEGIREKFKALELLVSSFNEQWVALMTQDRNKPLPAQLVGGVEAFKVRLGEILGQYKHLDNLSLANTLIERLNTFMEEYDIYVQEYYTQEITKEAAEARDGDRDTKWVRKSGIRSLGFHNVLDEVTQGYRMKISLFEELDQMLQRNRPLDEYGKLDERIVLPTLKPLREARDKMSQFLQDQEMSAR